MKHPLPQCFTATLTRSVMRIATFLLCATSGFAAEANADASARGLFVDVPTAGLTVKLRPTIQRHRVVTVDVAALRARKTAGAKLPLNLFTDADYEGVIEQVIHRGEDDYTLMGKLTGQEFSSFALAVKDGVVVMNIRTPDRGMFHLRHLGNGFYDVRQIDENKYPPCATGQKQKVTAPAVPNGKKSPDAGQAKSDSGLVIDVMVVYTPASRIAAGGTAAIQALISLAIDESNVAYQNSQITPRLRLVYQQEVSYTESATFETDLNRLTNTSDGYLDEVHALRNTYGADMVCLLIDNDEYCGLAWMMTNLSPGFESSAFSTVYWDCATGYYTLAHELGHNMGCDHDRENATSGRLYPYSYGWRFTTAGNVTNRTVMAYAPGVRVPYFSNPNVLYNGVATGVPTNQPNAANNVLTINSSAYTVANWRQTVPEDTNCNFVIQPANTNISGSTFNGTGNVAASSNGCAWTAVSHSTFINLTGDLSGTGNGAVTYSVGPNSSPASRTGTVLIAKQTFVVVQAGNVTPISLPEALDATSTTWTTGGSANWTGQNITTHDGVDAGRSGVITHGQQSYLEARAAGPGAVQFWWKVSSETNYDYLHVLVDGVTNQSISGEVGWQMGALSIGSGTHTVRWIYAKDDSVSRGQDAAWLDQVVLPAFYFARETAVLLNGNVLRMELRGPPSAIVIVEASTNLTAWMPMATNLFSPAGVWVYSNSVSTSPKQFYRAFIP